MTKHDPIIEGTAEAKPFELVIPVRVMGHNLMPSGEGVDVSAVGGVQGVAVVEAKVRTSAQHLVGVLALGRGFELVLREIATPGPEDSA